MWLTLTAIAVALAAPLYALMRYGRRASPRPIALTGAVIAFALVFGWGALDIWASQNVAVYGEAE